MTIGIIVNTAEVRVAQYDNGAKNPKEKMAVAFANVLNVRPHALTAPDIDTDIGLMHTLFALTGEKDIFVITKKEKVRSVEKVDDLFFEIPANYYAAYSRFYKTLLETKINDNL